MLLHDKYHGYPAQQQTDPNDARDRENTKHSLDIWRRPARGDLTHAGTVPVPGDLGPRLLEPKPLHREPHGGSDAAAVETEPRKNGIGLGMG